MSLPKRPKGHQIEDISVNAFKRILPSNWVIRDKSHDYGIDQEVEVFDEDDIATGIIFYVQVKATSSTDENTQKNVTLDVGTLQYYQELDLPVLIARYVVDSDEFHFKWNHEISLLDVTGDQKTKSVRFDDLQDFVDYSPDGLQKTAAALRKLRNTNRRAILNVSIVLASEMPGHEPKRYIRIIRQSLPQSRLFAVNGCNENGTINISATLKNDKFLFHVDSLFPTTIGMEEWDDTSLSSDFSYGLCTFLVRAQLTHHARILSDHLLSRQYQTQNRFLAFITCTAFQSDIGKSLELGLLNKVHHSVDEFWLALYDFFLNQDVSNDLKSDVIVGLNQASIDKFSDAAPPEVIAPLHYNLGNSYKVVGSYFKAISSYNRARKLDPDYIKRDYFLQEIGASLFLSQRYTPACKFYQMLLDRGEDDRRLYYLADALFFSGKLKHAFKLFQKICIAKLNTFTFEVILKSELIHFLMDYHQKDVVERNQVKATECLLKTTDKFDTPEACQVYKKIINLIDPLNATSAFNMGVALAKEDKFEDALPNFLIQAFTCTNDAEAWVNALACATSVKNIPIKITAAIAGLGQCNCGTEFNKYWDKLSEENNFPKAVNEEYEGVFAYLSSLEDSSNQEDYTLRITPTVNPESKS